MTQKRRERLEHLGKVWRVFEHMMDHDEELEDRREYDQEMLARMYDLNEDGAYYLEQLIQSQFDPKHVHLYGFIPCSGLGNPTSDDHARVNAVCENLLEDLHNSHDGWDDGEKVLITLYLNDIALASNIVYQDGKGKVAEQT